MQITDLTTTATLARFGSHAMVISGVRFYRAGRCINCHTRIEGHTDGGTITMKLRVDNGGKDVRWSMGYRPEGMPAKPETCANCGEAPHPCFIAPPFPASDAKDLETLAWEQLRAAHPELAKRADRSGGIPR